MELTIDQFKACVPKCKNPEAWLGFLNQTLKEFEINTALRIAHFLGQCSHESMDFNVTVENLNYSAEGLLKIFPKYFNQSGATAFARHTQDIANKVYANRLGNGTVESGDGWKYRGRGLIQITGKGRYAEIGKQLGIDLVAQPELAEKPYYACRTAGQFWKNKNINLAADADDSRRSTLLVNGGYNNLEDRQARIERIKTILLHS